jgi:acid phosphatase (class A)
MRKSKRIAVGAVLMLLTACAGRDAKEDGLYSLPVAFDVTHLLSPPPDDGETRKRDLAAVRAAQQARTESQVLQAEASNSVTVFHFASVLGPGFATERLPLTTRFFQRVYRSALPPLSATKACWNRPRPFVVDPTLVPLERSLASTKVRTTRPQASKPLPPDSPCTPSTGEDAYSYSYPSGHATVGTMMAILLAEMVPERREALFAAGWKYGEARVIGGVHFPSDVEAGRILGTLLIGMMQGDVRFRADLHAARQEVRKGLGYD